MPPKKKYDLGNLCQMFYQMLKAILIAFQENPSKIPELCEHGMRVVGKWQNRDDEPYEESK